MIVKKGPEVHPRTVEVTEVFEERTGVCLKETGWRLGVCLKARARG